jgi:hypothetical protein
VIECLVLAHGMVVGRPFALFSVLLEMTSPWNLEEGGMYV